MRRCIALLLCLLLPLGAAMGEHVIEEEEEILLDDLGAESTELDEPEEFGEDGDEPEEADEPEEPEEWPEDAEPETDAEEETAPENTGTRTQSAGGLVTTPDGAFPELNADGFLDSGEFLYENPEEGVWRYCSATLRVEVIKYQETTPKKHVWYEAEVWAAPEEIFHLLAANDSKRMTAMKYPHEIARQHAAVLAMSTDFAQLRYQQKARMGIIIREGKIYSDKTKKANAGKFPTLDVMAIYPDGRLAVYASDEYTAQEYLDMGAISTLAFGPYLIKDGELNETGMKKYGTSNAPRAAVGMVEPGHYFCMMLEGRHSASSGGPVSFLGQKMYDRGCTEAMNLDGGQTSCIVFMGTQICRIGGDNATEKTKARRTSEVLAIGTSFLVPAE